MRASLVLVPRCWSACASVALLGLASCSEPERTHEATERPPVFLFLFDALSAAHVSHLGYERCTTPNLDRLAAEGLTCRNALVPAPYTLASISSVLTGKLPDRHGLVERRRRLDDHETTLAETLRAAGWRTHAAVANFNGSAFFGCDQGFEEFVEAFRRTDAAGGTTLGLAHATDFPPHFERWLASADPRPPFVYLHVLEPHEPYDPPSCFRELWADPSYSGPLVGARSDVLAPLRDEELLATDADRQAVVDLYDGNVAWADWMLGRFLRELRERGLYDDALVIVTSDHGEAFWEHGEQGHNTTLYREMLRVPLVVKFPSSWQREPEVLERTVSPMDLHPSLCQWLDLAVPRGAEFDGRPIDDALREERADAKRGESLDRRRLVLRTNAPRPDLGLVEGSWKTIVERDETPPHVFAFDLAHDPGERSPLPHAADPRIKTDAQFLFEYYESARAVATGAQRALSKEENAHLESLGYAE